MKPPSSLTVYERVHSFGLQIAKASGAIVIATTSSDKKAELIKKLGADHVINYKTIPDWEEEVLKLVRTIAV